MKDHTLHRSTPESRHIIAAGAALMLLGVLLGAFGAHALKVRLSADMLAVYQTGVQYHLIHALGLMLVGLLRNVQTDPIVGAAPPLPSSPTPALLRTAAWLMGVGVVLFSGSLYMLAITGVSTLGALTPVGGVCFIAAWALVVWAMMRGN